MKMTLELQVTLIHVFVGAAVGFSSSLLSRNSYALLLAVFVLWVLGQAVEKGYKLEKGKKVREHEKAEEYSFKWWLSNGIYPYLIFWLFVWIIFYNL